VRSGLWSFGGAGGPSARELGGIAVGLPRQVGLGRWAWWLEGDHFGGQTEVRKGSSSERPTGSFRSRYAGPRLTWRIAKGSVIAVSRVRWAERVPLLVHGLAVLQSQFLDSGGPEAPIAADARAFILQEALCLVAPAPQLALQNESPHCTSNQKCEGK
jgi:hypothetical protein